MRSDAFMTCVVVLGKEKEGVRCTTDIVRSSFPRGVYGAHGVRCSCLPGFVCCARVVRYSSSPIFQCATRQLFVPLGSEVSHDWSVNASSSRKRKLTHLVTTSPSDVFWWESRQPCESLQVRTEDAGHQVKVVDNELAIQNLLM